MRRLFLVTLLLGCGGPEPAPATPSEPVVEAPSPECAVTGTVLQGMAPRPGTRVDLRASEAVAEGQFRSIATAAGTTAEDGTFSLLAPCGSRVQLRFDGWIWANEPPSVTAEPAAAPLEIHLVPERHVHLKVTGAGGEAIEATLTRPDGSTEAIGADGAEVEGVSYGKVTGTLSAPGHPSRTWRLHRSDSLHEVEPREYEATVSLAGDAPLWVSVPDPRDVSGIWCLVEGARGDPCKLRDGAWICACGGVDRVGVATKLWDVGLARDVSDKDVEIAAWPDAVEQCLSLPGAEGTAAVAPAGVVDRLLLGKTGPAGKLCGAFPKGEPLEVRAGDRVVPHTADAPGDVLLDG